MLTEVKVVTGVIRFEDVSSRMLRVETVNQVSTLIRVSSDGPQGPPGRDGDPGPPGTEPDLPDLILLFENGLV